MILTLSDVYAVGLGFDLAGGYLLGRGLLGSYTRIAHAGTISATPGPEEALRNRLDGEFGLAALAGGFLMQVVDYVSLESGAGNGRTGLGEALVFASLTAVSLASVFALVRLLAPRRRIKIASRAARLVIQDGLPRGDAAVRWGRVAGYAPLANETTGAYALRVWDIKAVHKPDEPAVKPADWG